MPSLPERRPPRLRVRRLLRRRLMRLRSITLAVRRPLLLLICQVLQRPPLDRVRRRLRLRARTLECCRLRSRGLRRVRRQCPRSPFQRRGLPHPRVRGLLHLRMVHPRALRLRPRIRRRRRHRLMDRQDRPTGRLLRRLMRLPRRRVLSLGRLPMARPPGLAESLPTVAYPQRVLRRYFPDFRGRRLRC